MESNQYLEIRRCFNTIRQETASASRIIFDEFAILCTLHERKGLSATQIAAEQGISCPTMTHRSSHLAQLGFMTRQASNDDRRRLRCMLTRKGSTYVHRTIQAIIDASNEEAGLKGMDPADLVPVVARMGSLPITADLLTLLCFAHAGVKSMPVMRIVEMTALLQPTVSMAVLRLEGSGCIERPDASPTVGRRPMRRGSGCVLTELGAQMAAEIQEKVAQL